MLRSIALAAIVAVPYTALANDADGDGVPDAADAFPCDGSRVAVTFIPSEASSATLLYEDNWPSRGDLDFNDAVIGYQFAVFHGSAGDVRGVRLVVRPRALGADIASGLALRLPGLSWAEVQEARLALGDAPASSVLGPSDEVVFVLAPDLRAAFGGRRGIINADDTSVGDGQTITLELELAPGVALDVASDPFDLFFFRSDDPSHEVHRPQFGGTAAFDRTLLGTHDDGSTSDRQFVDRAGLPFLLVVPDDVRWPRERVPVEEVWPSLVVFAASGGVEGRDFYTSTPADAAHRLYDGEPAAPPLAVDRDDSCVPPVVLSTVLYERECFDLDTGTAIAGVNLQYPCDEEGDIVFYRSPFTGQTTVVQNQCSGPLCLAGVEVARPAEPFEQIDPSDVAGYTFSRLSSSDTVDTAPAVFRTLGGVYKVGLLGYTCESVTHTCTASFRWQRLHGAAPGQPPSGPVRSVRFYTTVWNCFDLDTDTAVPGVLDRPYRCADGTDFFFSSSPPYAVITRNPCNGSNCSGGPLVALSTEAFDDVDASDLPSLSFSLLPPWSFEGVFVFRTPLGDYKVAPVRDGACDSEPDCHVSFLVAPL